MTVDMANSDNVIVSFVVPTLNRGRYVVRAVQSCLDAAAVVHVSVQVVVLDSESDDGSWELLNEQFAANPDVKLVQNKRGLGPTHSWLDGARLVSGDYVTFLWSDDFISPDFLKVLLPPLLDGSMLAIGQGHVRNIDDERPLQSSPPAILVPANAVLANYFGVDCAGGQLPVSPAAALFSRQAFDRWLGLVTEWSKLSPLRHELMWRRAIGPDLLLFMVAINMSQSSVALVQGPVAQFSEHDTSITMSSQSWPLRQGYWLAKLWMLKQLSLQPATPNFRRYCTRMIIEGLRLLSTVPAQVRGFSDQAAARAAVRQELYEAWQVSLVSWTKSTLAVSTICEALTMLGRKAIYTAKKRFAN